MYFSSARSFGIFGGPVERCTIMLSEVDWHASKLGISGSVVACLCFCSVPCSQRLSRRDFATPTLPVPGIVGVASCECYVQFFGGARFTLTSRRHLLHSSRCVVAPLWCQGVNCVECCHWAPCCTLAADNSFFSFFFSGDELCCALEGSCRDHLQANKGAAEMKP